MAEDNATTPESGTQAAVAPSTEAGTVQPSQESLLQQSPELVDWRAHFPEALRSDPTVQKYRTSADAAQALVHMQRMLGSSIQKPKPDASPEERAKFFEQLGRPANANDYTYDKATHLPEGVTLDPEFERRLKERAFESGLTQEQYEADVRFIGNWLVEAQRLAEGQKEQKRLDGLKELQRHFGGSTGRLRSEAISFFESLASGLFSDPGVGQQLAAEIEATDLASNPRFIAVFSEAWRRIGEGELLDTEVYPAGGYVTLDSVDARIKDLSAKQREGKATQAENTELTRLYGQKAKMLQRSGGLVATPTGVALSR